MNFYNHFVNGQLIEQTFRPLCLNLVDKKMKIKPKEAMDFFNLATQLIFVLICNY